ncbi:unnamed protein product [Tilletia caries]|nr:hypothetical protein A4X03_0g8806 [Tilletia caries]CAD6887454.1 unnamed protein product [Tilletia caries]CAD6902246.1 unnamed protein product [Tilletia controversa]
MGTMNGPRSTFTLITAPDADKTSSSLSERQERLEARADWVTVGKLAGIIAGVATVGTGVYGAFRYVTGDDKK